MSFVWVAVVATVFAFIGSLPLAGPIAVLVVSNAVNGKHRDALQIALGAAIAEGTYAFLAFWGFATFLARHPVVLPVSKGVTAVILLSLGIYFLRFKAKDQPEQKETKKRKFWVGFSVSILNPTLLATWSAVTTFLYAHQLVKMTGLLAIPFGVFAAVGIMLWALLMVAVMKRFRERFPKAALTWIVRGMGILLIAIAAWSAVSLVLYFTGHEAPKANVTQAPDAVRERGYRREALGVAKASPSGLIAQLVELRTFNP